MLVLFKSRASRYFVSLSFSGSFNVSLGALDCMLGISITDDPTVTNSRVYHDCVLEIFGERFPIDLVPITIDDVYVIAGMDWLTQFGDLIDCERQLVVICTPSGG